ncbi:MAG: response regulator, partial [Proteobacteria bacterium]|nr:response regulator [Pseudomonadota bacterium]
MMDRISSREKFYQLRKQAETLMINTDFTDEPQVMDGPLKLIHELQTFQSELELQNGELHRSQQELMKSNIRYTELYDFAPVGYLTVSFKGVILNANLTFADMLSVERSSLLDQSLSGYILSEDQDIYYQHRRRLTDTKTRQICELRMKKTNESPFYVQLESTILSYQIGRPEQYRTVVIDISERKQGEKERENLQKQLYQAHKMKSITTVAGGVAHDFNNILYIILGNVELLMQNILESNPFYPKLDVIKTAALRAAGIVKMLLNFSCRTEQVQKPIEVASVLNETFKLLRSLIPATIDIRTHLPDTGAIILADPIQFGQILINLCTNAAQAMEKTGGIIEIKMGTQFLEQGAVVHYPGLKAGDYVTITVSDNGPGIVPEIMDQIFDPYFTTRDVGKGSGLGLAVVHGVIKNHNGAIAVTGQPGKGACFTMFFPMIEQKPETQKEFLYEFVRGTEKILFVDDEVDITQVAEEALKLFGYQVEALTDPKDALALFMLNPGYFDVVVTDMTMPNMTGIELVEALRNIRPDIPIIISTGHSS